MVLKEFGGTENFSVQDVPIPDAGEGEVVIAIKAIGLDQIDIKTRKGGGMASYLRKEDPMILGWDAAGVVTKVGPGVTGFNPGDAVFGTIRFPGPGSTYAEYAAAPADQLAKKPENSSFEEAAAATQSPLTAWQALVENGNVQKGQRVLIHGGAGGVGSFAVQIAHARGCYVVATASADDLDYVLSLGADQVIDYRNDRFEEKVSDIDFILDTVGGETFTRSLDVLSPEGMIVLLPSDRKDEADKAAQQKGVANYRHILMHSSGEDLRQIAGMIAQGTLSVHVAKIFTFDQIPQAHQTLENGKIQGKIAIALNN